MTHRELIDLLLDKGYQNGWCLQGETLTLWQHNEEPPAPLKKPKPIVE